MGHGSLSAVRESLVFLFIQLRLALIPTFYRSDSSKIVLAVACMFDIQMRNKVYDYRNLGGKLHGRAATMLSYSLDFSFW